MPASEGQVRPIPANQRAAEGVCLLNGAAAIASWLSDAIGEEHDDLNQKAVAAAPWGGQTHPQHSVERKWSGSGVQREAFSSE